MTKSFNMVQAAFRLYDEGCNISEISRELGVSRMAIRSWFAQPLDTFAPPSATFAKRIQHDPHDREQCLLIATLPHPEYAYLLGQYLGDGCLSEMGPRGVFRLRIATCDAYPRIRVRCIEAVRVVMPTNKVSVARSIGCSEVSSYSKHWPCLFPQHGPGRKHERDIRLAEWQDEIVSEFTKEFVTGLIHSDGCRSVNNVVVRGKPYSYPRYFFSNVSTDILDLCAASFDRLGVEWRQNNWNSLSVAKRDSVALLDTFIGPKS